MIKRKKKNQQKVPAKKSSNEKRIRFVTENNNGLFQTTTNAKGKEVQELAWEKGYLVDTEGRILSKTVLPMYEGIMYDDYVAQHEADENEVRFLVPMSAHEDENYLTKPVFAEHFAELKLDGHRATVHINDRNRVFSRRPAKKSGGWFSENSDCVPHIRDLDLTSLAGTVLDGEFDFGTNSMGVQSVMGALPQNAIQYQIENSFIRFYAFDILYYKGINVQRMPLWKRKIYLVKAYLEILSQHKDPHIELVKIFTTDKSNHKLLKLWNDYCGGEEEYKMLQSLVTSYDKFKTVYDKLVADGKEGIMVKDMFGVYEQKKSKNYIKIKDQSTWDVIITGLNPPTKEYEGKLLQEEDGLYQWKYWYDDADDKILIFKDGEEPGADTINLCEPVSKPFAMGWCGGIRYGVVREETWEEFAESCGNDAYAEIALDHLADDDLLISGDIGGTVKYIHEVGDCKGLTEEVMEDLKKNGEQYIKDRRVLEVKANGLIDKSTGSLRHPRYRNWRDDKDWTMCTFKDHIREM